MHAKNTVLFIKRIMKTVPEITSISILIGLNKAIYTITYFKIFIMGITKAGMACIQTGRTIVHVFTNILNIHSSYPLHMNCVTESFL